MLLRILAMRLRGVDIAWSARVERGVRVGRGVAIGKRACLQKEALIDGNVEIGDETTIGAYSMISTMPQGRVKIGNRVLVNAFSTIGAAEKVVIGNDCIFAAYLQITDAEHGFSDPDVLIREAPWSTSPVVIEENVWIGAQVVVLKGVRIGRGSVIGAKSLVNKAVPAGSVAYGVPCRVRYRRKEE
ncbi:acyltransferase [Alcanivorax sp.]|uniref:acyltransferase n=1 Tax=Alcanivorax sp. TaxID=1872427 RepID=UPI002589F354|nr:acyltransferase [Alcanivorax sp.]